MLLPSSSKIFALLYVVAPTYNATYNTDPTLSPILLLPLEFVLSSVPNGFKKYGTHLL